MQYFADYLYTLTARDQQVTPIELVDWYSAIVSSATTTVSLGSVAGATYVVPASRVLVLTNWVVESTPGAATTLQLASLEISSRFSGTEGTHFPLNSTPADRLVFSNPTAGSFTGASGKTMNPVIVPGGGTVGLECVFNSGAAANAIQLFFKGILIPRGNIAI